MIISKVLQSAAKSLLVSALLGFSWAAYAQVELNVEGAQVKGIPIAVVPFKVVDGSDFDNKVHNIVIRDLYATGKFEPVPESNFLSFPSRSEEVRFKDWRFIDAEVLVIGEVWRVGSNNYEVQFRMYDVAREQEIGTGKRIPNLRKEDLRTAAHIVSDSVYEAFTGRPGAFNSRVAYIKQVEIEYQRYRYKLLVGDWDGFGSQEVYASWRPLLSPSWSPDGKQLAFVSFSVDGPIVQVLTLSTGDTKVIAKFKGVNSAPAWSPDGTKIAYSTSRHGSPDVYIYDVLTQQHTRVNNHYGIDTEPAWSPDGQNILFTSNRTGKPQIYNYNLVDERTTRMTFEGKENANASFDFDGKQMTMVHEGGQIIVMQEETSQVTWLTNAKFDESPSFSPNGDMVLYATEKNFEPTLMVASSDGRVRTRLEFVNGDVREPAWSPLKK